MKREKIQMSKLGNEKGERTTKLWKYGESSETALGIYILNKIMANQTQQHIRKIIHHV
jgi:hypothetical protein